MALFWHRRDLRLDDNRGLARAADDGPVRSAFVLDPDVLRHAGPPRVAFLLRALRALRGAYRDRGGDLLVRRGDPAEVLPRLATDLDEDRVVWTADFSGLARSRDDRVRAAIEAADREVAVVEDALLHPPGTVQTTAGTTYKVYSPFSERWRDREKDPPVAPPASVRGADGEAIPALSDLGVPDPEASIPAAGPAAARARLDAFLDGPIYRYAADRDYPAREGTSRLSADLKFGTIGIRTVWEGTVAALDAATCEADRESVEAFRGQLAWREFYAHRLAVNPSVVTAPVRDWGRNVDWRSDPGAFDAWRAGETGVPIVDAGMRQLREEAWMHNRARMIVASFLSKDLLIDWRRGYAHFREHLVDHDPANDACGWQWAASTGIDAQPYFRIFNPWTQAEDYDPDGEYVRAYVPELADATTDEIHGWDDLDADRREAVAPDYPAPIVDHAERREVALSAFEAARDEGP